MPYKIKIIYDTGDTFGTEEGLEYYLEDSNSEYPRGDFQCNNKETARLILQRLKEHYEWIASKDSHWKDDLPKPKWLKKKVRSGVSYDWYFNAYDDDGNEVWFYTGTYCGYFETLVSAEVETFNEEDPDRVVFR